VGSSDVAALFLTPENIFARTLADFRSVLNVKMSLVYSFLSALAGALLLWRFYPRYFFALWKNARVPQLFYHAGLLVLGMLLALHFGDARITLDFFHLTGFLVLLLAVEGAWLASVAVNDWYDQKIDSLTNPGRPLIKRTVPPETYLTFGLIFFAISLIFSGIVSFPALLLLLGYQALAWLYSAPPLRLKRYPLIATLMAASCNLLVLVAGFLLVSPSASLAELPLSLLGFLFLAYAAALPLKDFKDLKGDAADGVYTLPVLLGEKRGKHLMSALIFLLIVASPLVFNLPALFLSALLFAALNFWLIQKGTSDPRSPFSYHKLPGLVLATIALYGVCIMLLSQVL
jgi:4-hydroxybenzoate polyprenyltransferase